MTIVGGEERAMRAREVLAGTSFDMTKEADVEWAAWLLEKPARLDREKFTGAQAIRAMLIFAAEASGIGVKATALLNAYDEAKDEGGHYLWQAVDRAAEDLRTALAASISSREAE